MWSIACQWDKTQLTGLRRVILAVCLEVCVCVVRGFLFRILICRYHFWKFWLWKQLISISLTDLWRMSRCSSGRKLLSLQNRFGLKQSRLFPGGCNAHLIAFISSLYHPIPSHPILLHFGPVTHTHTRDIKIRDKVCGRNVELLFVVNKYGCGLTAVSWDMTLCSLVKVCSHFVRARFSAPVQTGSGAHPASCTMGTGSFPGVKRPGRGVDHPPTSSAEVEGHSWPVLGWTSPFLPLHFFNFYS